MILALLTVACSVGVAWANGANDVSKGVATLVGSRLATYRQGLTWGTAWTLAGAVVALALTTTLLRTFSTGLVVGPFADSPLFPLAVATGTFAWVVIASRTGLPVSTTHSLAGALVGAAVAGGGLGGVTWPAVFGSVAAPLAFSPFVAAAVAYLLHAIVNRPLSAAARYCVCFVDRPGLTLPESGSVATSRADTLRIVVVDEERACVSADAPGRLRVTDAMHWTTSAALSFARGLNDTPKIVAVGVAAAVASGVGAVGLSAIGAAAMGAGSYLGGRRVTRTLAERITDIDPLEGLSASAVAAALVLAASFVALPVSTTHVATGAIIGAGLRAGRGAVRWSTVSGLIAAWLITVPVAAAVSAAVWLVGVRYL